MTLKKIDFSEETPNYAKLLGIIEIMNLTFEDDNIPENLKKYFKDIT